MRPHSRWRSPSGLRGSLAICRAQGTETGGGHGRGGVFAWDQWDWPALPENVAQARDRGRVFALTHGAGSSVIDDLLLAISEAASNVVLHAFVGAGTGHLALVARAGRDRLTMSVIDDGIGMRPRLDSPGLGLGLSTIFRLVAGLEIRPGLDGRGTEVRMSFAAPGVAPRPAAC
jgi:anti-sigma regulatory factor (Ser/Thr protein kinase)